MVVAYYMWLPLVPRNSFKLLSSPTRVCFVRYTLRVPCTKPVFFVIFGYAPGYQTWLFWSFSGMYPGTKPCCFGHSPVCTRVSKLFVLVILRYVPWYQIWLFWLYSRVCTRVPNLVVLIPGTKLVLVILRYVPGYQT